MRFVGFLTTRCMFSLVPANCKYLLKTALNRVFYRCLLSENVSKTHKNDQNHLKSPGMVKLRYPILSQSWVAMVDTFKNFFFFRLSLKKNGSKQVRSVFLEVPVPSQITAKCGFLGFLP